MLSVELVDTAGKLAALEPAWNELLACSDAPTPFLSYEWFSHWWKVYGAGSELKVLVVRDGNEAMAIAPLMQKRVILTGIPATAAVFIGHEHSQRTGLLLKRRDGTIGETLLRSLKSAAPSCDVFLLDNIPEGSPTDRLLDETLARTGTPHVKLLSPPSPWVAVDKSWEEYYQNLPKSFRRELRKASNHICRQGDCTVHRYTEPSEMEKAFEEMMQVSPRTWKHKEGTSIASSAGDVKFYGEFARAAAARGWMRFWVMKHGERPVGFLYSLVMKGKAYALKIEHDEEFTGLSPGKYLNYSMIRAQFEDGGTEVDLMGRMDPHKMRWTSLCRSRSKYLIFNTVYGRAHYVMQKAKMFCQHWRRSHPGQRLEKESFPRV